VVGLSSPIDGENFSYFQPTVDDVPPVTVFRIELQLAIRYLGSPEPSKKDKQITHLDALFYEVPCGGRRLSEGWSPTLRSLIGS
jgi:hypothetical protein